MPDPNPSQNITARLDGINSVYPTVDGGVVYNSGTFDQSAAITVGGVTQPVDGEFPDIDDTVDLRINGDLLARATVEESGRDGENLVNLTAYSRERRLHQQTLTASYTEAAPTRIIKDAYRAANITPIEEAFPRASDFGAEGGNQGVIELLLQEVRRSEDSLITADFNETPAIVALQTAAMAADFEWKVTDDGQGWYGSPWAARLALDTLGDGEREALLETRRGEAMPQTWNLRWVLPEGTSPKFQAAAFDMIRVVGQPVESSEGGIRTLSNEPIIAEVDVFAGSEDGPQTKRVHVHEDDRITSQSEANNVARALYRHVRRQRSRGTITVVGDVRLRPLDSCRMLPELSESENGDFYHINNVTHRIDSEGFVTEVGVSGYLGDDADPDIRTETTADAMVVSQGSAEDQTSDESTSEQ